MSLSKALAGELLEISVGKSGDLVSSPVYLALLTTPVDRDADDVALAAAEATYPGYARVAVAASDWATADAQGAVRNANAIALPALTSGPDQLVLQAAIVTGTGDVLHLIDIVPLLFTSSATAPTFPAGLLELTIG